jgi:hypothetical protein
LNDRLEALFCGLLDSHQKVRGIFNWRQARRLSYVALSATHLNSSLTTDEHHPGSGYTQLVQVEEAFKNLKGDLRVRPVYHQKLERIEAHILVAFLAYSLHVGLRQRLKAVAGGLTSRAVLEKFCTVQMVDVHLPTTDGRTVIFLEQLNLTLPAQPPPKITAAAALAFRQVGLRSKLLTPALSSFGEERENSLNASIILPSTA